MYYLTESYYYGADAFNLTDGSIIKPKVEIETSFGNSVTSNSTN